MIKDNKTVRNVFTLGDKTFEEIDAEAQRRTGNKRAK